MHDAAVFWDLAIVLISALGGGLLAHFLRLPLFLGYIVGGAVVGSFIPLADAEGFEIIELFAEIGVVLLMFTIGLEFSLKQLLRVGFPAIIGGLFGMIAMIAIFIPAGSALGLGLFESLFIGGAISVSSTMVISKLLMERDEITLEHGRLMIGILLVEDLVVVVMLVLFPALTQLDQVNIQEVGLAVLKALVILIPVIWLAMKAVPPIVERIARTGNFELFILVSLAFGIGTAVGTAQLGLSTAMGAFLAGIIISESDYVHETLARILPLRDLFVALFFVSIGLLIDPAIIFDNWQFCLLLVVLVIVGKGLIRGLTTLVLRYPLRVAFLVAFGFTQIGEFSFVLAEQGRQLGIISDENYNVILAASLITIFASSLLYRSASPLWSRLRSRYPQVEKEPAEKVDEKAQGFDGHVVLFGYGRIGRAVGVAMQEFKIPFVVVEADSQIVSRLKQQGIKVIYGDASSREVVKATHPESAAVAIIALRVFFHIREAFHHIHKINPELPVLVRAHWDEEREELFREGVTEVIQPEFEGAIETIRHTLVHLGVPGIQMETYLDGLRRQRYSKVLQEWIQREDPFHNLHKLQQVALSESSPLVGSTLRDCNLRGQLGISVIQVSRASGEEIVNPPPDLKLEVDDKLLVMGTPTQLIEFIEMSKSVDVL